MDPARTLAHMASKRSGARVMLLAVDNHASKLAHRMALALLRPQDELQVVTVVSSEESRGFGAALLQPFLAQPLPSGRAAGGLVLVKGDERLSDVIAAHAEEGRADLVVCGSHHLCTTGSRDDPMPASGSFCLRLVRAIRCCPLLVVKSNTAGEYLRSGSTAAGEVMVDCQSNTRHLLSWLMDRLDNERATIFLSVGKAVDQGTGLVKETARRMLTNYSVQASVGEFYAAQRMFKDPGHKALPEAAKMEGVDIIALQAPACKVLPEELTELLQTARTSILVFNAQQQQQQAGVGAADDVEAVESAASKALPYAGAGR